MGYGLGRVWKTGPKLTDMFYESYLYPVLDEIGILESRTIGEVAKGLTHQYDLGVESEAVAASARYLSGSGFFCYWFGSCTNGRKEGEANKDSPRFG